MLHIVAGHLDLMRPHEEVKMIVVKELLGDVFSEHGSRLAARGLASLAVHGIGPEKVLQKTRHAVGEAIDLLDIAEQHAILLEESAMEDENALLKQRGDGESLEAFGEELHDGTVLRRNRTSCSPVNHPLSDKPYGRLVVAAEDKEAVRLHQLVTEGRQRHLHREVAAVGEIAWISVVPRSYR